MDPITATTVLTVLTPYLVKGGEQLVTSVASDLWSKVKSVFASTGDEKALDSLVLQPNSIKEVGKVEYILDKALENNPALSSELRSLLEKVNEVSINQNNMQVNGDDNISISDTNSSTITITTNKPS